MSKGGGDKKDFQRYVPPHLRGKSKNEGEQRPVPNSQSTSNTARTSSSPSTPTSTPRGEGLSKKPVVPQEKGTKEKGADAKEQGEVQPKKAENKIPILTKQGASKTDLQDRRLDSISTLITGQDVCGAVGFDDKRRTLLLATNGQTESEVIEKVKAYLTFVAKNSKLIANGDEAREDLQAEIRDEEEAFGKYLTDQPRYDEFGNKMEGFTIDGQPSVSVNIFSNPILRALRKVTDSIMASYDPSSSKDALPQPIVEAIENDHYRFVEQGYSTTIITGAKSPTVHAEMRVLNELLETGQIEQLKQYIGVSKRCCVKCDTVIDAVNKIYSNNLVVVRDDGHSITYAQWAIPNFLREGSKWYNEHTELAEQIINALCDKLSINQKSGNKVQAIVMANDRRFQDKAFSGDKATQQRLQKRTESKSPPPLEIRNLPHVIASPDTKGMEREKGDVYALENAFNQHDNMNYQYQGTDINAIGSKLEGIENNGNVIFVGGIGRGNDNLHARAVLTPKLDELNKVGQKIVGAYNAGGNHWVAFTIIKVDDAYRVFYKDSLGVTKREDLEKDIGEALGEKVTFHSFGGKEQNEVPAVSCGLFALENIKVFANASNEGLENLKGFYNPGKTDEKDHDPRVYETSIYGLRKSYAIKYAKYTYEQVDKVLADRAERQAITKVHADEVRHINEQIQSVGGQAEVDVATLSNEQGYIYRIICKVSDISTMQPYIEGLTGGKFEAEPIRNEEYIVYKIRSSDIQPGTDLAKLIAANAEKREYPEKPNNSDREREFLQALNITTVIVDDEFVHSVKKATDMDVGNKLVIGIKAKKSSIDRYKEPLWRQTIKDTYASQNAFNHAEDPNYQYQTPDILAIGSQIIPKNVVFAGALGKGSGELNASTQLNPHLQALKEGKKIVGTFNTGGNHWIAFAIQQNLRGEVVVAYNDSLAVEREDFEAEIKNLLGEDVQFCRHCAKITQMDGVSCGLFALKNMKVLAEAKDLENINKNDFYRPLDGEQSYVKSIEALRRSYAVEYAAGLLKQTSDDLVDQDKRNATTERHKTESEFLKKHISQEARCGVECEIRTEYNNPETYGYFITIDIKDLGNVKKVLGNIIRDEKQIVVITSNEDIAKNQVKIKIMPGDITLEGVSRLREENNQKMLPAVTLSSEIVRSEYLKALNSNKEIGSKLNEAVKARTGIDIVSVGEKKGEEKEIVRENNEDKSQGKGEDEREDSGKKRQRGEGEKPEERGDDVVKVHVPSNDRNEDRDKRGENREDRDRSKSPERMDKPRSRSRSRSRDRDRRGNNLKRYEKFNLIEGYNFGHKLIESAGQNSVGNLRSTGRLKAINDDEALLLQTKSNSEDLARLVSEDDEASPITKNGFVELMPENNHSTDHPGNVDILIDRLKKGEITPGTVICLERKQYGKNLGMADVIMLAGIIRHNKKLGVKQIKLPNWLKEELPIYKDAQLYNAIKDFNETPHGRVNPIILVGVEGSKIKYNESLIKEEQQKAMNELEKLKGERSEAAGSSIQKLEEQIKKQEEKLKRINDIVRQLPEIIDKDVGKDSALYDASRERAMAERLEQISCTGRQVIFPVGAAHIKSLETQLKIKGIDIKAEVLDKAKETARSKGNATHKSNLKKDPNKEIVVRARIEDKAKDKSHTSSVAKRIIDEHAHAPNNSSHVEKLRQKRQDLPSGGRSHSQE